MNATNKVNPDQASSTSLLERTRNGHMSLLELLQLTEQLSHTVNKAMALELYKNWIAFNPEHHLLHVAYFNYGVMLSQSGDAAGAIQALRSCIVREPKFGAGYINLGRSLEDCGLITQAVQQWQELADLTAEITPERFGHRIMALHHSGRVLEAHGKQEEAEKVLWQAIELQPDKPEAGQHWTSLRQRQCKWPVLTSSMHVSERQLLDATSPLTLSCYSDDPLFQLAKSYRYLKTLVGKPDLSGFTRKKPKAKIATGERLRIGYVSSDLRDHAVGFALREMLELHDKSKVEVFAYYCGEPRTNDETQERIKAAVDHWRDIQTISDADAARLISADEIDILLDVNGYTKLARTKIFAYRPAPVIATFCGFPGSTGSPFHQYIIADEHIIPPGSEMYYSEKVLHIPCNQPVDRKRQIGPRPSRADCELPEDSFVFACFNGMQKITEPVFARWMLILKAVPNSVLWMLASDTSVNERLQGQAQLHGIAADRIIFAPKTPNAYHLARIALADLFLDTFPYGAHSTAADAITMGLPVLTVSGKTFASRFCGSIVKAAGVPELICDNPDDYVVRAISLAKNSAALSAVRAKLAENRDTCTLRDMNALARRLEDLFVQMQTEAERGETPIPDLKNLDVYYEVGAEAVLENIEFEDDAAYRRRYREKLSRLHDFAPIEPDRRLWSVFTEQA